MKRPVRAGVALMAAATLVLAGCAESEREGGETPEEGGSSDTSTEGGETTAAESPDPQFIFAASAEPATLDPFYASDGETFRVARQMFEGLVGVEPGSADPAPLLATDWEISEDGLTHTFNLQDGVTFHDGTPFNAEAVCFNFDRWYNLPAAGQNPDLSYYYNQLFRGFAEGDTAGDAVYDSCSVDDDLTATVVLAKPFAGFIASLSLPSFSMQSPAALEEFGRDGNDPVNSEYAQAHPTGTGPFQLGAWNKGRDVTLTRYDDYWGETAKIEEAIVVAIPEPGDRADSLINGEIDGFDLVGPADIGTLEDAGMQVANRDPFNILYLGMNQAQEPLDDPLVRQAIAHAINRDEVISNSLPAGSEPAIEFIPPIVAGYADDVTQYEYDPDRARELLAEAGAEGATIEFNYPTGVSRPYMPSPEQTFNVIRSQLQAVGLEITATADNWNPEYLGKIQGSADHGIHLLGWTGDYNDTDNFIGTFFGSAGDEWGFDNPELFDAINEARGAATVEEQTPLWEEINRQVMDFLPGIPLAHPVPSLAFAPGVAGYEPSPVQDEVWNLVTVEE